MLPGVAAAEPAAATDWKFDVLRLKNGNTITGLLLEESLEYVRFQYVKQLRGQPTFTHVAVIRTAEIARIERLSPADRAVLASRLKALDPRGEGERARMSRLELRPAAWGKNGATGWSYSTDHFILVSNAREDIVRRVAVRLEEITAAYVRFLPPKHTAAEPTTILLAESLAEYQAVLKDMGRSDLLNLAFYDPKRNTIVCASDLQALGDDLERLRKQLELWRAELRQKEAELNKLYKGKVPESFRQEIAASRRRMDAAEQQSEEAFRRATRRLFQTLYHEAFHAYLANNVYRLPEADLPRWLNEGLAQIFETAIVEAGELRLGHADPERLQRVKAALAGKAGLVPLADLLRSGRAHFVLGHGSDQEVANQHYLTAWALAFYLTFERRLLGTERLDAYAARCARPETDPLWAFQQLVGEPLPQFERAFHQYLRLLQPDGSLARKGPAPATDR